MAPRRTKRASKLKNGTARKKSKGPAKKTKSTPRKSKRVAKKKSSTKKKKHTTRKRKGHIFIIVTDRIKNAYTVEGPMLDTTKWKAAAYDEGSNISLRILNTAGSETPMTRQSVVAQAALDYPGLTMLPPGSIVHP